MKSKTLYIIFFSLLLCSCEKEIELDYRDIEPIYVVNAGICNEGCEVSITKTRDIDNPIISDGIEVQSVVISDTSGEKYVLTYSSDGKYHSDKLIGISGMTYTLSLMIDDVTVESTSTMPDAVEIKNISMHWEEMMGNDMLHLVINVEDKAPDINYYYYRVLRNGKLFKWNVVKELDSNASSTEFDISLMSRDKAEKNDPDDYDSIIFEDDDITVEVRAIDLQTYDYLFSAKLSGQNSSNPINNFNTDSILGYFAAYYTTSCTFKFYYKDVAE